VDHRPRTAPPCPAPKPPLPPLQDSLDRITENTRALVQADRLAVSE
jgi:hypothetical protein